MICAISSATILKKIYGKNVMQVSTSKAVESLAISPKESFMDVLVLQPKDITSFVAKHLVTAISKKHEDIKVVYLYTKEIDGKKLNNVLKYQVPAITMESVKEAIDEVLEDVVIGAKETVIATNDMNILKENKHSGLVKLKGAPKKKATEEEIEEAEDIVMPVMDDPEEEETFSFIEMARDRDDDEDKPDITLPDIDDIEDKININADIEIPSIHREYVPPATTVNVNTNTVTIEERIKNIVEYKDWDLLHEEIKYEKIRIELLNESSQYAGCLNTLSILEQKISVEYARQDVSAIDKISSIRELCINKAGIKATANNLLVQKFVGLIDSTTDLVIKSMTKDIADTKALLNKLVVKHDFFTNELDARKLIDARLELRVKIAEQMKNIIEIFKLMNGTSQKIIENMDTDLPSSNAYLNEILIPESKLFIPENAGMLFMTLTRAVEEKRLMLSPIETQLESVFTAIFKLIEFDDEIIKNYQRQIDIFKANNTEEVIIMTTALKSAMRVYIGPVGTGVGTTVLNISGIEARSKNTILLDLRKPPKLTKEYNVPTTPLDEFLNKDIKQDLVICEESVTDVDRLEEIITKLNDKLGHYFNVNIILDETQISFVERLEKEMRTLTYVSNCQPVHELTVKSIIDSTRELSNVAKRFIAIAPPISAIDIALKMGLDVTHCQVLSIPYMQDVAKCTALGEVPYYKKEIRMMYEEGLRL